MTKYTITKEQARDIREIMKRTKSKNAYRRMQAVALRGEGKTNDEIAKVTGYNSDWVGQLAKTFCLGGIDTLIEDGRKGGNNRNFSAKEEADLLQEFEEQAKDGQVITIEEIAKRYDDACGKKHKSLSTVYYFLHKNDWRLVTPQKQHPGKASEAEIEASKKLT